MTNWKKAKIKYETDCLATQAGIARALGVTPQAVSLRAKREEWVKANDNLDVVKQLPTAKSVSGSALGKRSPENISILINAIARTGSEVRGCQVVGINRATLHRWKEKDAQLATLIQQQRAQDVSDAADCLYRHSKKDPKWAKEVLSRDEATKDQWGEQHSDAPTIVLNIMRDEVVISE